MFVCKETKDDEFVALIPEVSLAGHLKRFLIFWKSWDILSLVEGYKTLFITAQEKLIDIVISEMLTKGAVSLVQENQKKGFWGTYFL